MAGPLKNARHERFAQELAKGKSQVDAFTLAGYAAKGAAARANSSRLLTDANVANRVAILAGVAAWA
jgi:phage terminase small subunit